MGNSVKADAWYKHFRFAYTLNGAVPIVMHHVIADGETIEEGMALTISSNKVSEAASTSGALYGIAGADGDAGDSIPVYVGDRNNVFIGQCDAKTESLSFPMECDIVEDGTTDGHLVDVGASTEDVLHLLGKVPGDDDTDTTDPGRVFFQIKRSQFDALVAAR